MKKSLNILHFSLYLIVIKLHFGFNRINPALLLFKIPSVKKKMKENNGIKKPLDWYDNFWTNKKDGFALRFSGGWLIGIVALTLINLEIFTTRLIAPELVLNKYHFISLGVLSYLICYLSVFKNDLYLKYFKEFEDWTITEKRKNALVSVGFIFGVIGLFFSSQLFFH